MIACTENVMAYLEMATSVDNCDPSVNMTFTDGDSDGLPGGVHHPPRSVPSCGYNIAEQGRPSRFDLAATSLSIALTGEANVARWMPRRPDAGRGHLRHRVLPSLTTAEKCPWRTPTMMWPCTTARQTIR